MKEQKVKGLKLGSANTHKVQVDPINWLDSSWSMLQMVKVQFLLLQYYG